MFSLWKQVVYIELSRKSVYARHIPSGREFRGEPFIALKQSYTVDVQKGEIVRSNPVVLAVGQDALRCRTLERSSLALEAKIQGEALSLDALPEDERSGEIVFVINPFDHSHSLVDDLALYQAYLGYVVQLVLPRFSFFSPVGILRFTEEIAGENISANAAMLEELRAALGFRKLRIFEDDNAQKGTLLDSNAILASAFLS